MSSEKEHYWLVYYSHKDNGVHTEGHVVVSTEHKYFSQASMNHVRSGVLEGALIASISYLGKMTEEEWRGDA